MKRYTYKVTCISGELKNHYYLGKHKTNNLNDNYMGCSTVFTDTKKHPEKYIKEIIKFYRTDEALSKAESKLIVKHFNDPLCVNKHKGSCGGRISDESIEKIRTKLKGIEFSQDHKQKMKDNSSHFWKDKKRSDEFKNNLSRQLKGSKMMTDGYYQLKVLPEYWGEFIDIGFYFGHISNYGKCKTAWNKGLPKERQPRYGKKNHKK